MSRGKRNKTSSILILTQFHHDWAGFPRVAAVSPSCWTLKALLPPCPVAPPRMLPEAPQRLGSQFLADPGAPVSAPEFRIPASLACPKGFSCALWKG